MNCSQSTRRDFLGSLVAGCAEPALRAAAPSRRNVIFILVDDHRWDMMSAAAHPWLRTPHLDAMAAGGASFRNAFVTTSL